MDEYCGGCRWYNPPVCDNPNSSWFLTAEKFTCQDWQDVEDEDEHG